MTTLEKAQYIVTNNGACSIIYCDSHDYEGECPCKQSCISSDEDKPTKNMQFEIAKAYIEGAHLNKHWEETDLHVALTAGYELANTVVQAVAAGLAYGENPTFASRAKLTLYLDDAYVAQMTLEHLDSPGGAK